MNGMGFGHFLLNNASISYLAFLIPKNNKIASVFVKFRLVFKSMLNQDILTKKNFLFYPESAKELTAALKIIRMVIINLDFIR